MRLTLLGVASFHRACLLAQDFTHEPACQTGERAPQGRFRHQPEQMVHPPFAWQLASFPSLPVCGEEAPYCPLRDFATLRTYSPEIKARQALFAFLPVYPELARSSRRVFRIIEAFSCVGMAHRRVPTMGPWRIAVLELANFMGIGYEKYWENFPICPQATMENWDSSIQIKVDYHKLYSSPCLTLDWRPRFAIGGKS